MGQALLKGLRDAGVPSARLLVVEANPQARRMARRRFGARPATMAALAARCGVVIVAVKPQDIRPVLDAYRQALSAARRSRTLMISIAAGVTLSALERVLGRIPVVRVMPNLAAKVGAAVSAMAAGRRATASHRVLARGIFECVGTVIELPERHFDAVTAISGSGPAYFFVIFRALRDAGVRQGLPKAAAERLAVQTALGSARLVEGLREDLDRLIAQVASKKGTTEAALKVLARRRLADVLQAGVSAAAQRSKELSWSLSKS
ncbi:MAG: pyrroline-5-carboxylate reductase [Candidatus Omnitrophica bacterium]|nr:pyrroline-5-carboxylate reductase [Candidatus Omnitrophota bacterium]